MDWVAWAAGYSSGYVSAIWHYDWLAWHWPQGSTWAAWASAFAAFVSGWITLQVRADSKKMHMEVRREKLLRSMLQSEHRMIAIQGWLGTAINPPIGINAIGGRATPTGKYLEDLQRYEKEVGEDLGLLRSAFSKLQQSLTDKNLHRAEVNSLSCEAFEKNFERDRVALFKHIP